ncbi:hypothetical protein AB0F17_34790 [Nonomuraea sp. NPDC026600]|uniref:hypothetical protein n=1 Tax=Nonomuraea sp. NPDC026600 TaxID=3155363 RepID=UPI0033E96399
MTLMLDHFVAGSQRPQRGVDGEHPRARPGVEVGVYGRSGNDTTGERPNHRPELARDGRAVGVFGRRRSTASTEADIGS